MSIVTLIPAWPQRYGQDFRQQLTIERLGLKRLHQPGLRNPYQPPQSGTDLLISFNPEHKEDADALEANVNIRRIVHHQLRLSYLDSQKKKGESFREIACRSLSIADRIIVPADFMIEELSRSVPINKVSVIRNGAAEDVFKPTTNKERRSFRSQIGIKSGEILAGYVGSLSVPKGYQIIKEITSELPDSVRLLVRTYPEESTSEINELKALGKDRLILDLDNHSRLARRSHPTPFLDVLFVTSLCETVSMVVVEALLSGIPVITTGCTPFFNDLLDEGFGSDDLEVISLPSGIDSLERRFLKLEENDAKEISEKFLSHVMCKEPISFTGRSCRSNLAKRAGLTATCMVSKFCKLYEAECIKEDD